MLIVDFKLCVLLLATKSFDKTWFWTDFNINFRLHIQWTFAKLGYQWPITVKHSHFRSFDSSDVLPEAIGFFFRSKTLLSNVQPTYQSNLNHSQNNLNHLKRFNEFIFLKFDNRCFWFHQNRIVEGEKERERAHACIYVNWTVPFTRRGYLTTKSSGKLLSTYQVYGEKNHLTKVFSNDS